jgi:hypothetical protein
LTGCGCQEAECGADDEGDQNSGHDRRARVAVSGTVENLDEVVSSGTGKVGWEITEAEAEGNNNRKPEGAVKEDRADHAPGDNGRCILDFFGHVDGAIVTLWPELAQYMKTLIYVLTDEWQIGAYQSDEERETLGGITGCISWINEVHEDTGGVTVRGEVDQRDENSKETKSVDDQNEPTTCQPIEITQGGILITDPSIFGNNFEPIVFTKITTKIAAYMSRVPCHLGAS